MNLKKGARERPGDEAPASPRFRSGSVLGLGDIPHRATAMVAPNYPGHSQPGQEITNAQNAAGHESAIVTPPAFGPPLLVNLAVEAPLTSADRSGLLGQFAHAQWIKSLIVWFGSREQELNIRVLTGIRVAVHGVGHLLPDVVLTHRDVPPEDVLHHPPLAVFEVVTPQDTFTDVMELLAEYEKHHIRHILVVTSQNGAVYRWSEGHLLRFDLLTLDQSGTLIEWADIREMAAAPRAVLHAED